MTNEAKEGRVKKKDYRIGGKVIMKERRESEEERKRGGREDEEKSKRRGEWRKGKEYNERQIKSGN